MAITKFVKAHEFSLTLSESDSLKNSGIAIKGTEKTCVPVFVPSKNSPHIARSGRSEEMSE